MRISCKKWIRRSLKSITKEVVLVLECHYTWKKSICKMSTTSLVEGVYNAQRNLTGIQIQNETTITCYFIFIFKYKTETIYCSKHAQLCSRVRNGRGEETNIFLNILNSSSRKTHFQDVEPLTTWHWLRKNSKSWLIKKKRK